MATQPSFSDLFNSDETFSVENPEDGSIEFSMNDETGELETYDDVARGQFELMGVFDLFEDNLALTLPEDVLHDIGLEVVEGYETDEESREGHTKTLIKGMKNLGIANRESLDTVYQDACDAFHPLLLESAVKFQATEAKELLPANGPVKTKIIGEANEQVEKQATRIRNFLNWQITEDIPGYRQNTEKALFQCALFGDAFKKFFYNPTTQKIDNELVSFEDFVVNNNATSIEDAERITHVLYKSENQLERDIYNGMYRDNADLNAPTSYDKGDFGREKEKLLGVEISRYEGYKILEQHVMLNIPEDPRNTTGLALPYVISVDEASGAVLSIYRNWKEDGNPFEKRSYFTQYPFIPAFGFYNLGLIHLIGDYQKTLTTTLRALVDAGQLANLPAGFKSKSARLTNGQSADGFQFGEWKDVEVQDGRLADAFYPLPFKEPSPTLVNMFERIQAGGQKFADASDMVMSDSTNYGPVGTTMALLEASTKMHSAVHTRLHESQRREFKILSDLNYDYLPDDPQFIPYNNVRRPDNDYRIMREDFSGVIDVVPVSDPNISSNAHRVSMANAKLQSAMLAPDIHNMREVFKEYYLALGVEDLDKILPPEPQPQEAQPLDPVSDIMAATQGLPIRAFPGQDHDAHIAVKSSYLENPEFGANATMEPLTPILQANIREHVNLKFQSRMDAAMQTNPNVTEAAKMVNDMTRYLEVNPDGIKDPQQLLAEAQVMEAKNKQRELDLKESELQAETAIDIMEAQIDRLKVELDYKKHDEKLQAEQQLEKFEKAYELMKQGMLTQGQ